MATSLPATFDWTARPNTLWDDYELDLYDYDDGDPYWWTVPSLGYQDYYSLETLPPDFQYGYEWYIWEVWIFDLWGGLGTSYEGRHVSFASMNSDEAPGEVTYQARLDHLRARVMQRSALDQQQPSGLMRQNIRRSGVR